MGNLVTSLVATAAALVAFLTVFLPKCGLSRSR